ncbi:N(4)-(Beta-N-acetylglucosaminyl)-L-asparaginase [Anoplophora glabripennis]|uniref:N(4)-(Beta-N-acetylglucosaminyl)-L-asparaginase n=1 Tax=Anoplophora glabripennis TaxID=217634 RepID=UPI0008744886|nr:N(4)-(Beta-N-acetylglucosaminyl)-L-asparaginase [Anoplophora glabripennis]
MVRVSFKNILIFLIVRLEISFAVIPMVINTWKFPTAAQKAFEVLANNPNKTDVALDALTIGCRTCQEEQCGYSVGYGGNPDEQGETTLDALIFDGNTMDAGAVGGLRRVKDAISVARHILDHSEHTLLVGDLAVDYAKSFDFIEESLQTNYSLGLWENWLNNSCQPNFWKNVIPDPKSNCGPYNVSEEYDIVKVAESGKSFINSENHDTIGMIVISQDGHIVAGTSTNGLRFKFPGRVGDSPIPGAGAYADSDYGAACATGNGDIMMRFSPTFLAVEQLRQGATPEQAAHTSIARIAENYPSFSGAIIVVDKEGNIGVDCNGMDDFYFSIANEEYPNATLDYVTCDHQHDNGSNNLIISFNFIIVIFLVHFVYHNL